MSYRPRSGHSYGNNPGRRGRSSSSRAKKKTKWEIDVFRKVPCITKTEDLNITPCPEEVSEQSKPSVEVQFGNQAITSGFKVGTENKREIIFSTKESKPKQQKPQSTRPKKSKKRPYS